MSKPLAAKWVSDSGLIGRAEQTLITSQQDRAARNRDIIEHISYGLSTRADHTYGALVRPSDKHEAIQRWFHYREGYTLELCRRLFGEQERLVLDPFCGFGSTLLAARQAGICSVGLDVSPLATFVTRVKTRTYTPKLLRVLRASVNSLGRCNPTYECAPAPTIRILNKLFHPEILHALLVFRAAIDRIDDAVVRDFLLLGWIAVLENVSNVFREGNGIKYRNRLRRGNDYSVVPYEVWQAKRFPANKFRYIKDELLGQLRIMVDEASLNRVGPEPVVAQVDASEARTLVPSTGASLAMFSPPYCNCFNYIKAYKLELWMSGFIRTYPDIRSLTAMGIRSRMESLLEPVRDTYLPVIDDLVGLMNPDGLWSPQLPDLIRGYFADMQRSLASIQDVLSKDGRCIIVVGNSAYAGVLIPTDLLLARVAERVGFHVDELVVARHLTTSSQQKRALEPTKEYLRETLIFLRKD